MLDFARVTDSLTEMAGQALQDAAAPGRQGVTELLANAGLDPSTLAGLSEGEVMRLLSDRGIDPMQFAPDALADVLGSLSDASPVEGASLLQRFLGQGRHG